MTPEKVERADAPAKELFDGAAAQHARKARQAAARAAATADPLPGPLAGVFGHVPATIAGLTVRPLVHYDFVILRQIGSPLIDQLKLTEPGQTPFSEVQGYEMVFLFTRPVREAAAIAARGPEAFRAAAIETIGMALGPVEVALLIRAVEAEFVRAFSTAVSYGAPAPGADGTVFTPPPAGPKTGLAGGSTTSDGCAAHILPSPGSSCCSS